MKYSFPMIIPVFVGRVWKRCLAPFRMMKSFLYCALWGVRCDTLPVLEGAVIMRTRRRGAIRLGKHCHFTSRMKSNLVGLTGPVILDALNGNIQIGDNSGFSSVVISSRELVSIGCHCKFGGNVRVFDHDFHSLDSDVRRTSRDLEHIRSKTVVIENDVFVGANAIILKGTHIGARSLVAAGSVIFGLDVPPDSLVKGNPAVVVPKRV